ncbi:cellulose binding domain-containing protein [Micromonospora sp. ATCC 39149]|uniref:Cellulose binding domain-containing protein n=1 Tax=Micromonospora carbonacea TaxID=47853 RepID=A0A7D5Y9C7_9ACTN|nr:cellulose binding domain-containing protein [Micromonospora sp. ATCC 39149]QLJ98400.1 cellulose binding domain-containing protein [Micromonospora carbonacea]
MFLLRSITFAVVATLAALSVAVVAPSAQAATSDTTPPTAPTDLTWSATCAGVVTFNWSAATDNVGVTGYEVFREVSSGEFALAGTTTTTTFIEPRIAGLRYQVRARDAAGNTSPFTAPVIPVPPPCPAPDTDAPSTPGNPTAIVTCGAALLGWTASTDNVGVTGYEVWSAPGTSGGAFAHVATVTTTSFIANGPGIFRFQVRARDAAGNRSPFTPPINVVVPACPNETQPPTMPGAPTASGTTTTQTTLTWAPSTDNFAVTRYEIYRAPGPAGGTFTQVGTSTTTTFTDTGLAPATTYRYQVQARDHAGNTSPFSAAVTVTTPGGAGGCQATSTLQTGWNTGYILQPNTVTNTDRTTLNSWTVTITLPPGHTVTGYWNAAVTVSGQTVTARGITGQNAAIAPGAFTSWGMQVSRPNGDTAIPTTATCTSSR